jgi:hypothetical protein
MDRAEVLLGDAVMLAALSRAMDHFRGSGDSAVTSLDGALRPNQRLEAAAAVLEIGAPDNLACDGRRVFLSSGSAVFALKLDGEAAVADRVAHFDHPISCFDSHAEGGMAVGLGGGGLVLWNGSGERRHITELEGRRILCPTALRFANAGSVILCLGSQQNDPREWKRDLLDQNASGSVWWIDLGTNRCDGLADNLAWPNGIAQPAPGQIVVAESWRHQLIGLKGGRWTPLLSDFPGYPGRLAPAPTGYWLSVFAPRSQLVEFVLREPRFRNQMMREVEPEFWVAPSLHYPIDYREPLQAGAVRHLTELKPWAPSRSYGLVVRLDEEFNPIESFHSRANGKRHGITSCFELDRRLLLTSRGGGVVLGIDLALDEGAQT